MNARSIKTKNNYHSKGIRDINILKSVPELTNKIPETVKYVFNTYYESHYTYYEIRTLVYEMMTSDNKITTDVFEKIPPEWKWRSGLVDDDQVNKTRFVSDYLFANNQIYNFVDNEIRKYAKEHNIKLEE